MPTPLDVIQKFMAALDTSNATDGVDMLDRAVRASTSFDSAQAVVDNLLSNLRNTLGDSNVSNTDDTTLKELGATFLKNYCNIDLDNEDTGAITGYDANGGDILNAEDVVPETGDAIYPDSTTFTKNGLTVTVPATSTLTSTQQIIVQGLYSWWVEEGLNLISNSYRYSFDDADVTVANISLNFINDSTGNYKDVMAYVSHNYNTANGKATSLSLTVNMAFFGNISADDFNGDGGTRYLDRTLATRYNHAEVIFDVSESPKTQNHYEG